MSYDKNIKTKDYQHLCPFCSGPLTVNDNDYYSNHGQIGYECVNCSILDANTISGKPFSRYNLGVMRDVALENGFVYEQVIIEETFYIHYKDNKWYNVTNNLAKGQTVMVVVEPMKPEHIFYVGEKPTGLVWVSDLVVLPFIDSWNLSDQEATLKKIRTYLLFM
jgi:hypothetical protein